MSPTLCAAGMLRSRCGAMCSGFIFFGADDRNFESVRKDLPVNLVGGRKDPSTDGGKAVRELEAG